VSSAFAAHVTELLRGLGRLEARPMFGGHGLYCDGAFFALVLDDVLYLKADDHSRPRFLAAGLEPRRIVLTFAPCGRPKTLAFLRWLGVNVAPETERTIFGAANALAKSIEICRDNLRRILEQPYAAHIPLGVNVESVSINRDEIDASIELFHALSEVMRGRP